MNNAYVKSLTTWSSLKPKLGLTQDEWEEIGLKVKIAGEIAEACQSQELNQHVLEEYAL
ncbi:MAG: hypothetical protein FWG87_06715 [Defluviitaleaceae bacterium]|nr:hypothetical protein [Defluviitaleaceae bacterium]